MLNMLPVIFMFAVFVVLEKIRSWWIRGRRK